MLRYYYINKEWMVSGVACRIYRLAASLSLALFPMLVFLSVAAQIGTEIPGAFRPALKLLLFASVLGAATTMVAMEYFLFGFDSSSAMKKVFWFCAMLVPLVGPALYCFLVYSRSDVLKRSHVKPAEGASV